MLVAIITIFYRGAANSRYLPYVLGLETKNHFLVNNLNYEYGDFYDTDGFFKKTIKSSDRVLVFGIHNLYYLNFPFVDASYVKPCDSFNYILTRGGLPARYKKWKLVYINNTTNAKLYKR